MKANSDKSKQSNKATRRVLAGVFVRSLRVEPGAVARHAPISHAIANDTQTVSTEETRMGCSK